MWTCRINSYHLYCSIRDLVMNLVSCQQNALGNLGVGEESLLFNGAVFAGGLLNIIFIFGVKEYLEKSIKSQLGAYMLILASLSLALAVVFTVKSLQIVSCKLQSL